MINQWKIKDFSKLIAEYLCSGFTLRQSLEALVCVKSANTAIKNAAFELVDSLEKGLSFGNALRCCSSIKFDKHYIALLDSAESAGGDKGLFNAISYLAEECESRCKNLSSAILASVYPVFVAFLCVASSSVFLRFIQQPLLPVRIANLGLVSFCIAAGFFLLRLFAPKRESSFMSAFAFLLHSGLSVRDALYCVAGLLPEADFILEELAAGRSLSSAFSCTGCFDKRVLLLIETAGGNIKDAIFRASKILKEKEKQHRELALRWLEPAAIIAIALYLAFIVKTVLLPYFWNFGGII